MPKHTVATLLVEKPMVKIEGSPGHHEVKRPDGCLGVLFVFESKKAAYEWYGKKVDTVRIEKKPKNQKQPSSFKRD